MKVIFSGTPGFAAASLRRIIDAGHTVVAVVTAPDRPAGRGRHMQASEVKLAAQSMGLTVLQPERLRDEVFLETVKALQPDVGVVVAFRMLPEVFYSIPRMGTFNLHASLLPLYRGAAPIQWALINGEKNSGVTTFFINNRIDTGNILLQESVDIPFSWNAGMLHDQLMVMGAALVEKTLVGLSSGTITEKPQPLLVSGNEREAPKLNRSNTGIDWRAPSEKIYHLIRGLNPSPGAHTILFDGLHSMEVKLGAAILPEDSPWKETPGACRVAGSGLIEVACGEGSLFITAIQLPGKKMLPMDAFLRGYSWSEQHKFVP